MDGCRSVMDGCPSVMNGGRSVMNGGRSVMDGCPSVMDGCPSVKDGCPSVMDGCPSVMDGCPSVMDGCPSVMDGCPSVMDGCPSETDFSPKIVQKGTFSSKCVKITRLIFCAHGNGNRPHRPADHPRGAIFRRTESLQAAMIRIHTGRWHWKIDIGQHNRRASNRIPTEWTRSRPLARPSRAFGFAEFLSPFPKRLKSIIQPKVATQPLPWVHNPINPNPEMVASAFAPI